MHQIAIIGEAYGEREEREQTPFVGAAGYELNRMLADAGIKRSECFLTNVFNLRPPGNKIEAFCGTKSQGIKGYPALTKSKYVLEKYIPELERLGEELVNENPNVVICLGNTPTWALLGKTGITKLRGTTFLSTHTAIGYKLLPTYHPAAILRQWENRPTVIFDLGKARRESAFPDLRRPHRQIWIEPTLEDIHEFIRTYINGCEILSVDIETAGNQVTSIGFAPQRDIALVVPFFDFRTKNRSYWPTPDTELQVWRVLRTVLEAPSPRKVFQNGLYDITFLARSIGIRVRGAAEDTMLLHHAISPESPKALDYLGSLYTDEGAWKATRKVATIKKDD